MIRRRKESLVPLVAHHPVREMNHQEMMTIAHCRCDDFTSHVISSTPIMTMALTEHRFLQERKLKLVLMMNGESW